MTETVQEQEVQSADQSVQQGSVQQGSWPVECLTIGDCGPLYERIKESTDKGDKVNLDLSVCQEIDTAGLQLLTAIQVDPDLSLKVRWESLSEPVRERAARLGLISWIESGAVGV